MTTSRGGGDGGGGGGAILLTRTLTIRRIYGARTQNLGSGEQFLLELTPRMDVKTYSAPLLWQAAMNGMCGVNGVSEMRGAT